MLILLYSNNIVDLQCLGVPHVGSVLSPLLSCSGVSRRMISNFGTVFMSFDYDDS
jgi:hypothetical protein